MDMFRGLGRTKDKPIVAKEIAYDGTCEDKNGKADTIANRAVNCSLGLPAWRPEDGVRDRPAAIVGYGPTLNEVVMWLRTFNGLVWTVSKAHNLLHRMGVKVHRHTDVDMREHKARFIDKPRPEIEYILATHVHPTYTRRLMDAGVPLSLFHVATNKREPMEPGYKRFTARVDASLMAAELAYRDGYKEQHWLGIEYNVRPSGNLIQTHAGHHEGVKSRPLYVRADGHLFMTTELFFHGLMLGEQLLRERSDLKVTLHGQTLFAAWMADRAPGRVKVDPGP